MKPEENMTEEISSPHFTQEKKGIGKPGREREERERRFERNSGEVEGGREGRRKEWRKGRKD